MLTKFGSTTAKAFLMALLGCCFFATTAGVHAQTAAQATAVDASEVSTDLSTKRAESSTLKKAATVEEKLSVLQELLEQQSQRLNQLQQTVEQQQETIRLLAVQLNPASSSSSTTAVRVEPLPEAQQTPSVEDRLKKVESSISQLGNIKFSGDVRLRSESIFGQSNSLTNAANPLALGNELTPRHRMRLRARLTMRGTISEEFEWGLRLATGSLADHISTNQTFTDFFNRKPFALDQAFITYKPRKLPGLRLQGGRFELPWTATEMTIDNDLMVDGFNESYSRTSKDSVLKDVTFVAWQLPMLERNSAFVRNADGTVKN